MKSTHWFTKSRVVRTGPAVLLILALYALTARGASARSNQPPGALLPMTAPASLLAAPPLNCAGSASGFDLTIDKEHSSISGSSVICNYVAKTQGKTPTVSGFAVTVEYHCAQDTQGAWQSKTSSLPPWQPGTNPHGEISRSGNAVLFREDGPVSGFAGDFTVAEKMFLLIDGQTIATIVVHTDVKTPDAPPSGPAPNPDPKLLNLDATKVVGVASAVAGAHRALVNDLVCSGGPAPDPSTGSTYQPRGKSPVLATVLENPGYADVSIDRGDKSLPDLLRYRKNVKPGEPLYYGDTICYKAVGPLKLTWYDGTILSISDAHPIGWKGVYSTCITISLKLPGGPLEPGAIRDATLYIIELLDMNNTGVRIDVQEGPQPPQFEDSSVSIKDNGTTFVVGHDAAKGMSVVCAEKGSITVTPRSGSLAPLGLTAGYQTVVGTGPIAPIRPGCTLPSDAPIAEPNTNLTAMTLEAARRTVIAGDTVLVPVWLVNADNLANLNFALSYDASVVQIAGDPVKGDLLDNTLFKSNASQTGLVLTGLAQTSPLRGTGTVVNIPVRATGKPGDITPLLLNVTSINDPNGAVLNIDRIAGQITIAGPDGKVPGGSDPGSGGGGGAAGPQDLPQGDCDGDGVVTESDALCALEMSTQLRPSNPIMDIDNSGSVDSRDSVVILQKALGK